MTNPLAQDLGGVVLLPCPFCGYRMTDEDGGVYQKSGFIGSQTPVWEVCCGTTMCNASVTATSREFAITAWNTRAHSAEIAGALAEVERLNAIVNTPQANDFLRAVSTEAEHQRQRWGSDHDRGKTPADWFWLVGYLAGKALHAHAASDLTKAEHHVITAAAALANWHMAMFGNTDMCPGIDGESLLTSPTTGADGDNT